MNFLKITCGLILLSIIFSSCTKDNTLPKQNGFLRLEYPIDTYRITKLKSFEFETPSQAKVLLNRKQWVKIKYPALKAIVNITYRPIKNNIAELRKEATQLTLTHVKKADDIFFDDYQSKLNNTRGKVGNVTGNAASPLQFHITDNKKHFIIGTVYFNTQPNYDSIYPAIKFIKKDILHLMETTKWY